MTHQSEPTMPILALDADEDDQTNMSGQASSGGSVIHLVCSSRDDIHQNVVINLDRRIAFKQSNLLRNSLEPNPEECEFLIPSTFSIDAVRLLVEFMCCTEPYTSPTPPIEHKDPVVVFGDNWYAHFLSNLTTDQLFNMLILSNWMDCPRATDALTKTCAMLLTDLDRTQIQHMFGITKPTDAAFADENYAYLLNMMDFRNDPASM
jgi:hypothetical protein